MTRRAKGKDIEDFISWHHRKYPPLQKEFPLSDLPIRQPETRTLQKLEERLSIIASKIQSQIGVLFFFYFRYTSSNGNLFVSKEIKFLKSQIAMLKNLQVALKYSDELGENCLIDLYRSFGDPPDEWSPDLENRVTERIGHATRYIQDMEDIYLLRFRGGRKGQALFTSFVVARLCVSQGIKLTCSNDTFEKLSEFEECVEIVFSVLKVQGDTRYYAREARMLLRELDDGCTLCVVEESGD